MYQVPSEFIRQKATVVWFLTVEHAIAAFGGYLLAHALGGGTLVTALCVGLGLAATTLKVQGLTLYRFLPLLATFLVRKVSGDTVEPEEGPAAAPQVTVSIRDAEGKPVLVQEQADSGYARIGKR
jgi:membrane protein implicated in regulation of membrane protease activity